MIGELTQRHDQPFTCYEALYRRLNQLRTGGYINRRKMLWNGEYYYFLTKSGIRFLELDGLEVPTRAKGPIAETLQHHEYEVSRFFLKFWWDCDRIGVPVSNFWRDGTLSFSGLYRSSVVPDGSILTCINGEPTLFLLEMDRSTHTVQSSLHKRTGFCGRLKKYRSIFPKVPRHPLLRFHNVKHVRLLVVCLSETRLNHLMHASVSVGFTEDVAFICLPRIIITSNPSATGWRYRRDNLLTDPLFSRCGRSPPRQSLL